MMNVLSITSELCCPNMAVFMISFCWLSELKKFWMWLPGNKTTVQKCFWNFSEWLDFRWNVGVFIKVVPMSNNRYMLPKQIYVWICVRNILCYKGSHQGHPNKNFPKKSPFCWIPTHFYNFRKDLLLKMKTSSLENTQYIKKYFLNI